MSEAEHTPGPWEISRDAVPEGYTQNTVYAERDGERVATAFRNEANARLIAAAPDLLEACKAALDAWHAKDSNFERELNKGTPEWLSSVRTAIAKAEVRSEK